MKWSNDQMFKQKCLQEDMRVPESITQMIDDTLKQLPKQETTSSYHPYSLIVKYTLCCLLALFILLPNLSPHIAYAMEKIPILGDIVKIITIKNYFSDDDNTLDASIPNIQYEPCIDAEMNSDIDRYTQKIMDNFYDQLDENTHQYVKVDYEVITDTKEWFTLKLQVLEVAASSDVSYQYYHIDKSKDKIVVLDDLFKNQDYKKAISNEIEKQMKLQMKEDNSKVYWLNPEKKEWSFIQLDNQQNFYFSQNGNIVIVFDKYEVAPGYMGTPEFEIDSHVYEKYLK